MLKLEQQINSALHTKSKARGARYVAKLEYLAALKELRSLRAHWHAGRISQRTYHIYKDDTTEMRKDLERDALVCKNEVHLAHVKHEELVKQLQEQRRQETQEQKTSDMRKAEHLLSDMSPDDIRVIRKYLEI